MLIQNNYFASISEGKVRNRILIYGGKDKQDRTHHLVRSWDSV